MIVKTLFFDKYIAAIKASAPPATPTVAFSYSIKAHSVHAEQSLCEDAKALQVLGRLEQPDVRFFTPGGPVKRIKGSLCILPLLVGGRLIDVFCAEVHGGVVALAIYSNEPLAAFRLIDEVWEAGAAK